MTIGHNPFPSNLGLSAHIVLNSVTTRAYTKSNYNGFSISFQGDKRNGVSVTNGNNRVSNSVAVDNELSKTMEMVDQALIRTTQTEWTRYKFLDMYLYDRLFFADKPFTTSIVRNLRASMEMELNELHKINSSFGSLYGDDASRYSSGDLSVVNFVKSGSRRDIDWNTNAGITTIRFSPHTSNNLTINNHQKNKRGKHGHGSITGIYNQRSNFKYGLPYGVHHINPTFLTAPLSMEDSSMRAFIMSNIEDLKKLQQKNRSKSALSSSSISSLPEPTKVIKNSDPSKILAFTSKLDDETKRIIDQQQVVQHLYECRIASLERYIAFCVMFHAMAKRSSRPWISPAWDIARSQSNLRVATTGKSSCGEAVGIKKIWV